MNISSQEYIEISFSGNNISPDKVKVGDIADILKAIEVMIESQVYQKHPEIKKEQVIIGFTRIKSSSIDLQFRSPLPEITFPAFSEIGRGINQRDFSNLPSVSYKAFGIISAFTKKQQCTAELIHQDGKRKSIAVITPDIIIKRPQPLKGETIVYATVVRVGGKEPKVEIETINGCTLFCDAPYEVTKKLGTKLYQTVGLIGIAEWDLDLIDIEQFEIKDVIDYEQIPIKDAINELAKITRTYYSDIIDVEKYISSIRGSDEEK